MADWPFTCTSLCAASYRKCHSSFGRISNIKMNTSPQLIRSFTDFHASEAYYAPATIRNLEVSVENDEYAYVRYWELFCFTLCIYLHRRYYRFWYFKSLGYSLKYLYISVLFLLVVSVYMTFFKCSWRVLIITCLLYFILCIRHCLELYHDLQQPSS